MSTNPSTTSWWSELSHFGQTLHAGLAPKLALAEPTTKGLAALAEALPDFRAWLDLSPAKRERDHAPALRWIDAVLEGYLGHSPQDFLKTSAIGENWKAKAAGGVREFKPDRILRLAPPSEEHALPIFISFVPLNQKDGKRRALDLDRFLREKQIPMGLITDGQSLRWVVTGTHQNAFTQWDLLTGWNSQEGRLAWQGLYTMLGRGQGWKATPDARRPHQLGCWLLQSSEMQGELSTTLGEQIREAVEALVHALDRWSKDNPERLHPLAEIEDDPARQNQALYTAAVRLVMRMVVIAFAESRDLLPTTFREYRESYSLEGLWHRLRRSQREVGFDEQQSAWMQLLALFRLVQDGSHHPLIHTRPYGGELFRPGDHASDDPVSRALALWEDAQGVPVSDKVVFKVLTKLKQTKVKVQKTYYPTPVDFSTLSTEYIGLLYEGLLDYDLRTADEPMLMLDLGQQPLLPLSLLKGRSDKDLKDLLLELAKEKAAKTPEGEDGSDDGDGEPNDEEEEANDDDAPEDGQNPDEPSEELATLDEDVEEADEEGDAVAEARKWAEEAARLIPTRVGCLGRAKKGQLKIEKPDTVDAQEWEERLRKAGQKLVPWIIPPGERFLTRWSGTRKGSGTFYTRPTLTEPLIRETLRPLCYETDGTPKLPETILGLRVVDPAMGSASFLVGAVRFLTDALYDSLACHRFEKPGVEKLALTMPFGLPATGDPEEVMLPVRPDHPDAEKTIKGRLKRYVVERCLYGVDLNPLAVELAKMAVWVETMDRDLPFGFLDHKLRCGNALVGCWMDRLEEYPTAAWSREGGDKADGVETKALKEAFICAVGEMQSILKRESVTAHERQHGQAAASLPGFDMGQSPVSVLSECRSALETMHSIPPQDVERISAVWRDLQSKPNIQALLAAMDRWCALFYWPGVQDGQTLAPAELPMPSSWNKPEHLARARTIAEQHRFFHWELAFPEVFRGADAGFDAALGNPPWEILKPNSNEFFTVFDPIFRTYKGTKADDVKAALFAAHPGLEARWKAYAATYKSHSGWAKGSDTPFRLTTATEQATKAKKAKAATSSRGPSAAAVATARLEAYWVARRGRHPQFSDPNHPLRLQGSADLNTYKMFLEQTRALLRRGGRLGFIVPSGLYTDEGSQTLRRTFFDRDHWELLFGFENQREIFKIHRSFKFVATVVTKETPEDTPLQAVFMRLDATDLATPADHTMPVTLEEVRQFSPKSISFMELRNRRDLEVVQRLYKGHPLLGDLELDYNSELHMTNDSKLWAGGDRKKLESLGLLSEDADTRDPRIRFGLWKAGWMPLLEGKHFWQFNPGYVGIRRRKGAGALSAESYQEAIEKATNTFRQKQRFIPITRLVDRAKASLEKDRLKAIKDGEPFSKGLLDYMGWLRPRLVFRDVARSTDQRSFIAGLVPPGPHGNTTPDIKLGPSWARSEYLCGLVNSFTVDWMIRRKVSAHLNKFYIETLPIPKPTPALGRAIGDLARDLCGVGTTPLTGGSERLTARIKLDALVAFLFDLSIEDFEHILLDPSSGAVGFHRLDADLPEPWRQPTLSLEAYKVLRTSDLQSFLKEPLAIPAAAQAAIRPTLAIWSPPGGWDAAWEEAKAMAESEEEWDLFLGKPEAIEHAYGFERPVPAMVASTQPAPKVTRAGGHASLFHPDDLE